MCVCMYIFERIRANILCQWLLPWLRTTILYNNVVIWCFSSRDFFWKTKKIQMVFYDWMFIYWRTCTCIQFTIKVLIKCPTDHSVLPLSPSFMMLDPLTGRHSPGMQSNWTYSLDILSYCTCRNIFIHSIYAGTIVSTHADDVIVFNPGKKKKNRIWHLQRN